MLNKQILGWQERDDVWYVLGEVKHFIWPVACDCKKLRDFWTTEIMETVEESVVGVFRTADFKIWKALARFTNHSEYHNFNLVLEEVIQAPDHPSVWIRDTT
jgi:hypothetical protein